MADLKISQLLQANVVNKEDLLYLIQDGVSENVSAGTLFASITDPTFSGNITFGGPAQTLYSTGRVDVSATRTDLYGGVSANPNAIANGSVLPSTIFLYTEGVSASGRGLTFANATPFPFTKTIYVRYENKKIRLGAAQSALYSYHPDDWVGPVGLKPFPDGLYLQKGSTYIFDVSDQTNSGNVLAFSSSIDGTNTLGTRHTANITVNGTPGTAGANIVFAVPDSPTDAGGRQYLELPQGTDGQLKLINLVSTDGGKFVLSSNIRNNLAIELGKTGDSAFLMYSGNAWLLIGSNPGLVTTFSGTSDDVPEGQKLYFTNARARAAISAGDGSIVYDQSLGTIRAVVSANSLNLGSNTNLTLGNLTIAGKLITLGNVNVDGNLIANTGIITPANIIAGNVSATFFTGNGSRLTGIVTSINSITGNLAVSNSIIANGFVIANGLIINGVSFSNTLTSNTIFTNEITSNIWNGIYTANVLESASNLYFTNARVYANVQPLLVLKANVVDLTTANIIESASNLYYTNTRVYANVKPLLDLKANVVDLTTANVIESASNLYYTNARVQEYLTNVTGTILPAVGNMIDIGSNDKPFRDLWLFGSSLRFSNSGSISQSANNFVVVDGSGTVVVYANANAKVITSPSGKIDSSLLAESGLTTANIPEGGANLYYSNDRVFANISLANIDALYDVDTTTIPPSLGQALIWNGSRWVANTITVSSTEFANIANVVVGIVNTSQYSNIANTVLGLVNASIQSAFANVSNIVLSIDNFTTSNLIEGANLYYTNARVRTAISAGIGISYSNTTGIIESSIDNFTTSNLREGSNLYYTNARVRTAIFAGNGISYSNTTGIIESSNSIIISANVPANPFIGMAWVNSNNGKRYDYVYDGDSAQWVQLVLDSGYGVNFGDAVTAFTTASVSEATSNLYFTNARVITAVSRGQISNISVTGNVVSGNVTTGSITAGNVSANYLSGNGSQLIGIVGLASRITTSGNTATIAANASSNITIAGYLGYALYKIQTNAAAWVRIYTNAASRVSDFSRNINTDPNFNSGVIAEIVTTDANTIVFAPAVYGFNDETFPSQSISVCVVNTGTTTKSIKIDLTILKLEA